MCMISEYSGKISFQDCEIRTAVGGGGIDCSGVKASKSSFVGIGKKGGMSSLEAPPTSTLGINVSGFDDNKYRSGNEIPEYYYPQELAGVQIVNPASETDNFFHRIHMHMPSALIPSNVLYTVSICPRTRK
jgi:hypothetical protein